MRKIVPSKYNFNVDVFKQPLSPEAEYWAGLIAADGSVSVYAQSQTGYFSKRLAFGLSGEDIYHVYSLRDFIGGGSISHHGPSTGSINGKSFNQQARATLQAHCHEIVDDLIKLGIGPKKTKILEVDSSLSRSPNFWRGAIDGDGTISTRVQMISASFRFLHQFQEFLNYRHIDVKVGRKSNCEDFWVMAICGSKCRTLLSELYKDPQAPGLLRKATSALKLLAWQAKV